MRRPGLSALGLAAVLALGLLQPPRPGLGQGTVGAAPAAALLAAAERRAREGDATGALADYEQIVRQFPESPEAPEAMLRIARGQLAAGDRDASLAAVARLAAAYPGAPQAASGLVLEGRMRAERPVGLDDLEGARKVLEKVWLLFPASAYPGLDARSAARVLDGEIALRLGRDAEATTSFLQVVEMEPLSPWTADARIGLGEALVRGGEWQAAAESFQEALAVVGAASESLARARRRLALLDRRLLRPASGAELWSRARVAPVPGAQLDRLTGVAADDRGGLLLVDSGGGGAALLASAEGALDGRWPVRAGERPSWGRDGAAYIAADDAVLLPGASGRRFRRPGRDRDLDGIRAIERGAFGEWIVLGSRSDGVLSYPAEGADGRPLLGGDGDPVDLATDGLDRLLVLEKKGRRVVRVGPGDGRPETVVRGAWRQAAALAVDPFGYIHVLDAGEGRVHSYDPAGVEIGTAGPLLPGAIELRRAEDLAASGDGRLFIADARTGLIVIE